MIDPVGRETSSHGRNWDALHDGYFSDQCIAAPLIEQIRAGIESSKPDLIIDLGGGTGFLLQQLIRNNLASGIQLLNLDVSPKQLEQASDRHIRTVQRSLTDFARADAADPGKRILFIMRSVLHYYGREGLEPVLRHLRAQMQTGEFFVHQTACADEQADADFINLLYGRMDTGKWYPMSGALVRTLENCGWSVASVSPAPALLVTSGDLGTRYGISPDRMSSIRSELARRFAEKRGIFEMTRDGFRAYLHYKLFTCVASG